MGCLISKDELYDLLVIIISVLCTVLLHSSIPPRIKKANLTHGHYLSELLRSFIFQKGLKLGFLRHIFYKCSDKSEKHKEIELEVTGPNSFSSKDNKIAIYGYDKGIYLLDIDKETIDSLFTTKGDPKTIKWSLTSKYLLAVDTKKNVYVINADERLLMGLNGLDACWCQA